MKILRSLSMALLAAFSFALRSYGSDVTSTGMRIIINSVLSADANVVATIIVGPHGVMHEIDAVLLPK